MKILGNIYIGGDKSLSHRAIILASMCYGESTINNVPNSDDVLSTIEALQQCGIKIKKQDTQLKIIGQTFHEPTNPLDCRNSGTTMRLLAGLVVNKEIRCTLVGDKSLSSRPMQRIVEPLRMMGVGIESQNGCAPIEIHNFDSKGINYTIPVVSAQVKSCLILAALGAIGESVFIEKTKTRDHLELMIQSIHSGLIDNSNDEIIVNPMKDKEIQGFNINLPGDVSSASYLIALTVLIPGSKLIINDLLLNPLRMGFIDTLQKMGANIQIDQIKFTHNEKVGRLTIKGDKALHGCRIRKNQVPLMIDEVPILSLVCSYIDDESTIEGLEELRYKESNRFDGISSILKGMGVDVSLLGVNGIRIRGKNKLYNTTKLNHMNDHRLAMMISVAQVLSGNEIEFPDCINISFPNFKDTVNNILEIE